MTITLRLLSISIGFFLCLSCCKDDVTNPVLGTWKLSTWTIDIPFDSNSDGKSSTNYLNYTNCSVNETLKFDSNGFVTSDETFNPELTISLKDGSSNEYMVNEICSEGEIGFSSSFDQPDGSQLMFNDAEGIIQNKELTVTYPQAIKIYNESLTEVLETRDLVLIYKKEK